MDLPGHRRGRPSRGLLLDPLTGPAGGTLSAALDASGVNVGLFDEGCAGAAAPESREPVASAPVLVARP